MDRIGLFYFLGALEVRNILPHGLFNQRKNYDFFVNDRLPDSAGLRVLPSGLPPLWSVLLNLSLKHSKNSICNLEYAPISLSDVSVISNNMKRFTVLMTVVRHS